MANSTTFRAFLFSHRWLALIVSIPLIVVAATGSAIVFEGAIDRALNPALKGFEASCFDGVYITGDVSAEEFATMAAQRKSQGEEEEGTDRSRLALQNAVEPG